MCTTTINNYIYNFVSSILFAFAGTPCMVMKCVIVQRDENGYGLTVSGNNPVFVQSVKEGNLYLETLSRLSGYASLLKIAWWKGSYVTLFI